MSEKGWIKNELDFTSGGDFVPLDGMGFLSVCYDGEAGGDILTIDVVDIQLLQEQHYLNLLKDFVNANVGISFHYVPITVLENGLYYDRGGIVRDWGGVFALHLDHGFGESGSSSNISKRKDESIPTATHDAPKTYHEKIVDSEYLASIAHLPPDEFVGELGLDWEEVQTRFHAARGNISRDRTDLWIKQCVLYGNEEQRDIAQYTASPAKEGLVRSELADNDMLVIIATRQSIAYIKSREVVRKGELFVWEDLRGNQKVRGRYATREAWKNRTALKEGNLDKQKVLFLLTMFYGLENDGELSSITGSFNENAGYEQFTDLIYGAQSAIGDEKADGIADAGFIAAMKKVLEIGDGPHVITVAYIAFRYMYGGWNLPKAEELPDSDVLPDHTPPADALYVDESYSGIRKPIPVAGDDRSKGSYAAIRRTVRQYLPHMPKWKTTTRFSSRWWTGCLPVRAHSRKKTSGPHQEAGKRVHE